MAALAEAFVRVRADTDDARKQVEGDFTKAGKTSGSRFGRAMKSTAGKAIAALGGAMAGLFAAQKIGQFFKGAITGASDLAESGSKVEVVFGKAAKQVLAASKTSAQAMGLSKQAYLDATGTLGNLLVSLEIAPKKAANMSQEMVKLAGDLASFNNTSPEEALDALRSGLVGETEPLKRFGVNMNEATLRAQAMKMGLVDNVKTALNPQHKALAAQALIMKQTKTAQGDFARTSGGLANQQRILSARFKDVQASVGQMLLPIITKLVTLLSARVLPAVSKFISFTRENADTIRDWAAGIGIAAAAMGVLLTVVKAHAAVLAVQAAGGLLAYLKGIKLVTAASKIWAAGQWLLNAALTANPIGIVVVAIAALVAAFVIAYKKSDTFRKIVHAAMAGVKKIALAVAKWFAGPFVNFFKKAWKVIQSITRPFVVMFKVQMLFIQAALKAAGIAVKWLWKKAVAPAFRGIAIIAKWLWRNNIAPAFRGIAAIAKWLWRNAIGPYFRGIQAVIRAVWVFIRDRVFNPLRRTMTTTVPNAFRRARDLIGRYWKGIQNLAKRPVNFIISTVYNKGIRGFIGKIAKFVGQKNPLPYLRPLAGGGPVPAARAGWRKRPTAVIGEGSRSHPEVVVPTDPRHRRRAMGLFGELGGRLGLSQLARGGIIPFGRYLQGRGFRVGEHPAFGGVAPVHSRGSYHYRSGAIDVNYGPGGSPPIERRMIDKLIASGIARAQYGLRSIWRYPGHFGHAHFDVGSGRDLGRAQGGGGGGGMFGWLMNPLKSLRDKLAGPLKAMAGKFGNTGWVRMLQSVPRKMLGDLARKAGSMVGDLFGFGGGGGAGGGAARSIVQGVAGRFGWGRGAQWRALSNLISRESSWNPRAQNPTSSAYGLFQFLDSTWRGVGGRKTSDPQLQALYGMRYIRQRYGSPIGAMSFWNRNRWYQNGSWSVPATGPALVHKREMIIPERIADSVRTAMTGRGAAVSGRGDVTVNVGPVSVADGADAYLVGKHVAFAIKAASF